MKQTKKILSLYCYVINLHGKEYTLELNKIQWKVNTRYQMIINTPFPTDNIPVNLGADAYARLHVVRIAFCFLPIWHVSKQIHNLQDVGIYKWMIGERACQL